VPHARIAGHRGNKVGIISLKGGLYVQDECHLLPGASELLTKHSP
jgi:hypothetical protein